MQNTMSLCQTQMVVLFRLPNLIYLLIENELLYDYQFSLRLVFYLLNSFMLHSLYISCILYFPFVFQYFFFAIVNNIERLHSILFLI